MIHHKLEEAGLYKFVIVIDEKDREEWQHALKHPERLEPWRYAREIRFSFQDTCGSPDHTNLAGPDASRVCGAGSIWYDTYSEDGPSFKLLTRNSMMLNVAMGADDELWLTGYMAGTGAKLAPEVTYI